MSSCFSNILFQSILPHSFQNLIFHCGVFCGLTSINIVQFHGFMYHICDGYSQSLLRFQINFQKYTECIFIFPHICHIYNTTYQSHHIQSSLNCSSLLYIYIYLCIVLPFIQFPKLENSASSCPFCLLYFIPHIKISH